MTLNFYLDPADPSKEKFKELRSIVKAEMKQHFFNTDIEGYAELPVNDGDFAPNVQVSITNNAYFQDLQKAKELMYEEKGPLKDFVSDVEENLSFVCFRILAS